MKKLLPAMFNGLEPFGDPAQFQWWPLVGGAGVDAFLGNTPGTTGDPTPEMRAIQGVLVGSTSADVQAAIDALAALAGICGPLGLPTASQFPGENFVWVPGYCHFNASEFVPGSIVAAPGNQYQSTYKIVLRRIAA